MVGKRPKTEVEEPSDNIDESERRTSRRRTSSLIRRIGACAARMFPCVHVDDSVGARGREGRSDYTRSGGPQEIDSGGGNEIDTTTTTVRVVEKRKDSGSTWEAYVQREVQRIETDSWFFVPLLLEALGVSRGRSLYNFEHPEGWGAYVDRYRNVLVEHGVSVEHVVVKNGTYITASSQEDLMGLDPVATAYIAEWIINVRQSGGVTIPPLPSLEMLDVNSVTVRTSGAPFFL